MNVVFFVIDQPEWGNRTWLKAKIFFKSLVRCKSQLTLPETFLKIVDIELSQMFKDHQIVAVTLMIAEEDVLAPS